jgi:hypothetical protein
MHYVLPPGTMSQFRMEMQLRAVKGRSMMMRALQVIEAGSMGYSARIATRSDFTASFCMHLYRTTGRLQRQLKP